MAKEGDYVEKDQPVLELHIDDESRVSMAKQDLEKAISIESEPREKRKIILERIS